jgi:hypothetical protein
LHVTKLAPFVSHPDESLFRFLLKRSSSTFRLLLLHSIAIIHIVSVGSLGLTYADTHHRILLCVSLLDKRKEHGRGKRRGKRRKKRTGRRTVPSQLVGGQAKRSSVHWSSWWLVLER